MDWTPIRNGKTVAGLISGLYVITKATMNEDTDYYAEHAGKLIGVCTSVDAAKLKCEQHAAPPETSLEACGGLEGER